LPILHVATWQKNSGLQVGPGDETEFFAFCIYEAHTRFLGKTRPAKNCVACMAGPGCVTELLHSKRASEGIAAGRGGPRGGYERLNLVQFSREQRNPRSLNGVRKMAMPERITARRFWIGATSGISHSGVFILRGSKGVTIFGYLTAQSAEGVAWPPMEAPVQSPALWAGILCA
jgi:hypothetical protein